ncbi:ribonuclease HII [Methanocaldococcus infernus]
MKIGVDEAGRGPVIGPLVVCAYASEEEIEAEDSKKLSKEKREKLRKELEKKGIFEIVKVSAEELNRLMKSKNLNEIEVELFAKAIKNLIEKHNLKDVEIYVDSCSPNREKFKRKLLSKLRGLSIKDLIVEHKADEKYKVVSAASIIAKTERDREIEELKKIYGDFGSGYPSDPKTKRFLLYYYNKYREFPSIVREHWETCKRIKKSLEFPLIFSLISDLKHNR